VLVLVSFVLVLAAAVTLVVGLLQSGLTLIYLSIACSVLAGIVLAVAVLRGRPEPKPAAAGRPYTPPQPAPVPASVGAPASGREATTSWSPPSPPPPPPPPSYTPPAAAPDDSATKAAGAALLGRLRGKRGDKGDDAALPEAAPVTAVQADEVDTGTTQMPVVTMSDEDDDGFPIADYERLRATELLSRLPSLDRNQLEAVRDREANGKNRFTIMSRVDALLASTAEPAWEVDDDEWEGDEVSDLVVSEAVSVEEDEAEELDEEDAFAAVGQDEYDDEWDAEDAEEPATAGGFPIAGYETLTVGQILPRLSELGPDELAQVRTREEMGRSRGTILDRIDRLASRSAPAPMAMPPAAPPPPAAGRKAPARKAPARRAPDVTETSGPAGRKVAKPPSRAAVAAPRKTGTVRVTPAKVAAAPAKAARKTAAAKAAPVKAAPAPRKARAPKAAAPLIPEPTPMKEAVKKARAAGKTTKKR